MGTPPDSSNPYALGHENPELERLINQARFYGDLSAHLFALAGLQPGMHVLDAGCGAGDLAFLAASIVGPSGSVLGIDRSAESIALASTRAAAAALTNVGFAVADAATFVAERQVDAVIGRLFLMYFANPALVIRQLASNVKSGGIVTFTSSTYRQLSRSRHVRYSMRRLRVCGQPCRGSARMRAWGCGLDRSSRPPAYRRRTYALPAGPSAAPNQGSTIR